MSKADKMFKDLKYVKTIDNEEYILYSSVKNDIFFDLDDIEVLSKKIGVNEHLAIHEKIKELGWLDE